MKTRSVALFRKYAYSFNFSTTDISQTAAIDPTLGIAGEVIKLVVILPNWTNTVTARVTMNNADGKEIFLQTALDQNDEYDITLIPNECIIMGQDGEEWQITLSGAPGGKGGAVVLYVYMES